MELGKTKKELGSRPVEAIKKGTCEIKMTKNLQAYSKQLLILNKTKIC